MQEALSLRKKIVKTNNKAADRASMAAYEDAVEGGHTLDLSTPLPAAMPGAQQHEQLDHHQHHQQQLGQLGNTLQDTEQMQQGSMVQQQEDFLTASLKQQFMTDISSFFQAEVVPRSMAISEDVANLQYEAEQLAAKSAEEKASMLQELERLQQLVASFQTQIRAAFMAE